MATATDQRLEDSTEPMTAVMASAPTGSGVKLTRVTAAGRVTWVAAAVTRRGSQCRRISGPHHRVATLKAVTEVNQISVMAVGAMEDPLDITSTEGMCRHQDHHLQW